MNGISEKLSADLAWHAANLALLGFAGLALNISVLALYDVRTLGIVNQVYALYIGFSQLAVMGVHFSTLKHVAQYRHDAVTVRAVVRAALALTGLCALAVGTGFWLLRHAVASWLQSPGIAIGMAYAAPGLVLFALNKVLFSVLNGERRMQLYAGFQALRPLVWLATLGLVAGWGWPGERAAVMLSAAEAVLVVGLLGTVHQHLCGARSERVCQWWRTHWHFGVRSVASGVLVELNTRVDVLMLGSLTTDAVVGMYSFAAIVAEGFLQLLMTLRTHFNPILVQHLAEQRNTLQAFIRQWKCLTYIVVVPCGVVGIAVYPIGINALHALGITGAAPESWTIFALLMAGILVSAGYLPFTHMLLNAGRPGLHSAFMAVVVTCNVIGNLWLIPVWLARGAALATGLSFVVTAVLIMVLCRRVLWVRL